MSSPRKTLKERIGMAKPEEQPVVIASADPAPNKAREGWEAIDQLVRERNDHKARADRLELERDHLITINNNERARADHRQRERDYCMRSNAELRAYAYQCRDLICHMVNILDQNSDLVQRMPMEPRLTNNPGMPAVIDSEAQFDDRGMPYNSAPPSPTPEELKQVIERIGANGGAL